MLYNGKRKGVLLLSIFVTFILSCKKVEKNIGENVIFENGTNVQINLKPGLAVRIEPSTTSKKILEIPFNESAQIISCKKNNEILLNLSGSWCQIKFLDKEGWVFAPLLRLEKSNELPFRVFYGKAIRELPPEKPAPLSSKLVLYQVSIQGHDIGTIQFALDEKMGKGKKNSCRYWSGPPHTEESSQRHCDSSTILYKRNGNELSIDGKQYKWDGRFEGFISLDDNHDWKEIFAQAFEGKPHPEGEYNSWTLEESNCRFYEGDPYGGAEASFLCEKLGYDDSCQCFEK
ncbi:SH3 domain-containing protein [Leptospira interrogans]|uniref:SH3 domain-containing protein n=1 Tax=Leptospira interrogans TaxID=173 RepID=UPI000292956D|nr:SH3 domain-containing protein [Leptospira interrogans]EKO70245.1 SH3 domain protein [Leptospira interrogans serovar Canicola str. Fiocruz LV133]EMK23197.1 SH3 domain protein [Leptospira interrogans str. Kito]EMN77887.1 SH3 domain protein [Leptospira interrogans str. UI 09600]MCR8629238.1 SH3 domain-containing protein [Leptospira interrogans serovar Canicola]OLZ32086.1 SH3 domain-containing protein [Leptospira interrogans serovar Canicola]